MAVNLSPIWGAGAQLLDNSGNVLSGGKIYTYAAGTTTPATTYTSNNGITANSNPIILNSAGRVVEEIWLTDGVSYKFVLKDSNDTLIATYDNLTGINSNFIAYTAQQEIQTATAGQTVFNLTTMQYQPGTHNLSVFVDGVNQYGPGAQYAFVETDSDTVTFVSGLHVGASVKFTTASPVSSSSTNAENVAYDPPFTGSVPTTVEEKLSEIVSVKDFGAVGDGVTDDTAAIQNALAYSTSLFFPEGEYLISDNLGTFDSVYLTGVNASVSKIKTTSAITMITVDSAGSTSILSNLGFYGVTTELCRAFQGNGIRLKVYDCLFSNLGNDAIYLTDAIDCSFENSYFTAFPGYGAQSVGTTTTRTSSGVVIATGSLNTNNTISFYKCYFQSWLYGIKIVNPSMIEVDECVFEFNFIGCYMYRPSGTVGSRVTFTNNWLEQNYYSLSGGALFNDFSDQTNANKAIQQVFIGLTYQYDNSGRDKITGINTSRALTIGYTETYPDTWRVNNELSVVNNVNSTDTKLIVSGNCSSFSHIPTAEITTLTRPSGSASRAKLTINTLDTSDDTWTIQIQGQGSSGSIRQLLNGVAATSGGMAVSRLIIDAGVTGSRPASPEAGMTYYDTTLQKPIWYTGSSWKDAAGTVV